MNRKTRNEAVWYSWDIFEQQGITAGTTCRKTTGGEDFNLAFHTPGKKRNIRENRKKLCAALNADPESFISGDQTHSCNSRILPAEKTQLTETDALILTDSSLMGVILTADCLPVILYDPGQAVGAVVHAGWKGTAGGIVPLTLKRMITELGCREEDILAASGPAIGDCCYQVDRPVFHRMTQNWPETSEAFHPDGQNHWRLSLEDAVSLQLQSAGLAPNHIETAGLCTCCHRDFFSWRGDGKNTGRIGTFLKLPKHP